MLRRACGFALLSLVCSNPGWADDVPLRLFWDAPPGCPTGAEIHAEVARLLGSAGDGAPRPPLEARAHVAREGAAWRVRIETSRLGSVGERTLDGDSCAPVAAAAALILAMTLDPDAVRGAAPTPPVQPAPPPPEAPAPPPAPTGAAAPAPATPIAPTRIQIRPAVVGGLGVLPGLGVAGALGVAVRRGRWEAQAFGQVWRADQRALALDPDAGASFRALSAGLGGCRVAPIDRATARAWRACLGLAADRIAGRGFGVSDPAAGTAIIPWPFGALGGEWRLSSVLAIRLDGELGAPLSRPRFTLQGRGPVWRPPPMTARVSLGAAFSF